MSRPQYLKRYCRDRAAVCTMFLGQEGMFMLQKGGYKDVRGRELVILVWPGGRTTARQEV